MRTPDHDGLPGDGGSSQTIGEGFGGVAPEEIDSYGADFYDDDDSVDDDSSDNDSTTSDSDSDDSGTLDPDDIPTDGDMTEAEAEEVLEDVLEDAYGEEADDISQELQEDTGMSALEILEDLTGLDLDSSDDPSYAADYDRQLQQAAEADASVSEATTTSDLFNEDMPAESDFDVNLDGHVDRHDLDDAAHDMGFDVGN